MPWLSRWCPLLWKDRGHTDIFGGKPEGQRQEMRVREGTERDVRKEEQWRSERRGRLKVNKTKKSAWFLLVIQNLHKFRTHIKTCTSSQDTFLRGQAFQAAGRVVKLLLNASIDSHCISMSASRLPVPPRQWNTRGDKRQWLGNKVLNTEIKIYLWLWSLLEHICRTGNERLV